jgi:predicted nuclease of restriction endonuclease-like (RecB) superfamily
LINQIEKNYHLRIGNGFNNFNKFLPKQVNSLANGIIKDPYVFDFLTLTDSYNERDIENAMVERIKNVLVELGKGFSFVGNQYKISTDNNDYYIDLLFYHLELRCYVVVELKNTVFKPEYIGQLNFYVTAVNKTLKKEIDNETIGLLLCKEKDKLSVEWSLEGISNPIGVSSYKIKNYIPEDILEKLPTEDDINMHIKID